MSESQDIQPGAVGDLPAERDDEEVETADEHVHTWAAHPTGDDPYNHVCTECGETKSDNPAA